MMRYIQKYHITKVMIDLRYNQGGHDEIGTMIMSYFVSKKTIAH